MDMRNKTICILLALQMLSSVCDAQSWREHFSGEVDVLSTYVYRGMKLADPSAIAMIKYNQGGFIATAEAGRAFNGRYMDTMLSAGYKLGEFTVEVRDQYFPIYDNVKALGYFNWDPKETSHQVEALLTYAPEKLPIKVQWSTYFAGYDLKYSFDDQGNFSWGKRAFSSYLELTCFHKFQHMHTVAATVGASVNRGLYTGYEKNFAVVNTRLAYMKTWIWKSIYPTAGAYLTYNPYADKLYPIAFLQIAF